MRHVLHIFWKDVRYLWYEAGVAVFLTVGMAIAHLQFTSQPQSVVAGSIGRLSVVAWVLLMVRLMQVDSLVGMEHDWLTRPIRRRDLVMAKVLFVAVFLVVPMIIADVIDLVGHGFAPQDYLPGMCWKLVWLIVVYLAPAAAIGAITRTVPQALMGLMGAALLAVFSQVEGEYLWSDRSCHWVKGAWMGLTSLTVAVGVLWLQYKRRWTTAARSLAIGGLGLALITTVLLPWGIVFGVQRLFGTHRMDVVRLAPIVRRLHASLPGYGVLHRVEGVPEGFRALILRAQTTVDVDGTRIISDLYAQGELHITGGSHFNSPARIQGRVWLAILARQKSEEVEVTSGRSPLPGLGRCEIAFDLRSITGPDDRIHCLGAYRSPLAGAVLLGPSAMVERRAEFPKAILDFSPIPSEGRLLPVLDVRMTVEGIHPTVPQIGSRVRFETWVPVAYVERSVALDVKRLGDYSLDGVDR